MNPVPPTQVEGKQGFSNGAKKSLF